MRARPECGASVLTVVPKAASVQLVGCKLWCEIVYNGQHGYVFEDFVGGRIRATVETAIAGVKENKTVSTSSAAQQPALPQPPRRAISTRLQWPAHR